MLQPVEGGGGIGAIGQPDSTRSVQRRAASHERCETVRSMQRLGTQHTCQPEVPAPPHRPSPPLTAAAAASPPAGPDSAQQPAGKQPPPRSADAWPAQAGASSRANTTSVLHTHAQRARKLAGSRRRRRQGGALRTTIRSARRRPRPSARMHNDRRTRPENQMV